MLQFPAYPNVVRIARRESTLAMAIETAQLNRNLRDLLERSTSLRGFL
jgi:hypothetical protein